MRLSELRKLVREIVRESIIDDEGLERAGIALPQTKEVPSKKIGEVTDSKTHKAETDTEYNFLQHHKTSAYAPDYGYPAELDTIDFDDKRKKQAGHQTDTKDTEDRGYEPVKEDKIPGGLSGGMKLTDIAKKHGISVDMLVAEFKKGIGVEMEHTTDREIAKEIALDHLFEDPKYYTKLSKIENPTNEGYTKGQLFGGAIKIGGQPVKIEVELLGADDTKKVFITKVINIDKKYLSKLPSNGVLEIPARIFRTPGGGWYKIKTPSAFENANHDCGCGCGGTTENGCNSK
jgi:hypothetical protein